MDKTLLSKSATNAEEVRTTTEKLLAYCRANEWAGYDPYDAVNSKLFTAIPPLNSRFPRLILTQLLKRSPIDIRRLLLIPKTQNPKALAVFLAAFIKLSGCGFAGQEALIRLMIQRLKELRSEGTDYWCWGYSFPWQTRTIVVPTRTPNLVCTTFVANSLLNAYELTQNAELLIMAKSAAEYILNELYWTDGSVAAGFSYPLPTVRVHVHNANLLGAALLCRVYKHTGDDKFVAPALRVARYSASKQESDGSWFYGESPTQKWVDNFHTGYNLGALQSICNDLASNEFEPNIRHGFKYYREHFFREDGAARYFHNNTYPIDIHCVAQSIITLAQFRELNPDNLALANRVFTWAKKNMWDERGYFYYRVLRLCTIRIPYMRWSEAWMLLALATLLCETKSTSDHSTNPQLSVVAK